MGLVGLRAILGNAAAATDGVAEGVPEDSCSSTSSKDESGVPDGDPSFPLSLAR